MSNLSKTMSYALRHSPQTFNLTLMEGGWVEITALAFELSVQLGQAVSVEDVLMVAAQDNKQRFTVNGNLIRAAQGHSIPVELGLVPSEPPAVLFHGTVRKNLASIMSLGLLSGSRQHVHLSAQQSTAETVGARHGAEVVLLQVAAHTAFLNGAVFFQAENGVWLTGTVEPTYIRVAE
jgi:putative RNA 2'-phosphotransferase